MGSIVENDLKLIFKKDSMSIFFPSLNASLVGQSMLATVHQCLSFLFCNFVLPSLDSQSLHLLLLAVTCSSFPHINITPALWHSCLRHPEQDTTRAMLTKNYATEVGYSGTFLDNHCILCIMGKQPACPFDNFQFCASEVCDLLHMD